MPYVSTSAPGGGSGDDDPCKHEKNGKKKYMIYMGLDNGKMYIGRSSGEVGESSASILSGRLSTGYPAGKKYAERKITQLVPVHETEKYGAMRGAEEKHQKFFASHGVGAAQDNPISPRHKSKKDYEDCAKQTFPDCPICGA